MSRFSLVLVSSAVAVVLGLLFRAQTRNTADAQQRVDAQAAELELARAEIMELKERAEIFQQESEALREQLASARGGAASPSGPAVEPAQAEVGGAAEDKGNDFLQSIAKMYKDPETRKALRSQQVMGINMMYGDLAEELGLAPDEAARVMELLTDRQMEITTKSMEALSPGSGEDPGKLEETGKAVASAREEHDGRLRAVLGEARMTKFDEYERTIGDKLQMQMYLASFNASGLPLKEDQRKGLLKIMREERLKAPPSAFDPGNKDVVQQFKALGSSSAYDEVIRSQQDLNQRVYTRANAVLSPDQMNAFQAAQRQQLETQQMQMKMSQQLLKPKEQ